MNYRHQLIGAVFKNATYIELNCPRASFGAHLKRKCIHRYFLEETDRRAEKRKCIMTVFCKIYYRRSGHVNLELSSIHLEGEERKQNENNRNANFDERNRFESSLLSKLNEKT